MVDEKELIAGKACPEMIRYLSARRSVKASDMLAPGPNAAQLQNILKCAARVPDHGRRVPFYFVVFEGGKRDMAGKIVAKHFAKNNPDAPNEKIEEEAQRFNRASLVVGVVYRARQGKHPIWEQILTAGAVCENLVLAANAEGFAAQWLSEWYAYDEDVRTEFGLDHRDVVAGFVHLGTNGDSPLVERGRPELEHIVTHWAPGVALNKGDAHYDTEKFDIPHLGFDPEKFKG